MPRLDYKGSTPGKDINRSLVWRQHLHLLGAHTFEASPHVFLASRYAADVTTLFGMGVRPSNVWAVEKERDQYKHLLTRQKEEEFFLYTEKVEDLIQRQAVQSLYLDFCGNLEGTAKTTSNVVSRLPSHTALSITLFLGRELDKPESREAALTKIVRQHAQHQVTLVQSVLYKSTLENVDHGSPMGTWTFYLGSCLSRSRMRFDLTKTTNRDLTSLLKSPEAVEDLWNKQRLVAKSRSDAAVRANVTRRAA